MRKKLPYLLAAPLIGAITVLMICFAVTYRAIDERSSRDEARAADAIVVLGSAVWPNEQPSPSLTARTQRAIELYHEGYASHLILSGGLGRFPPEEAEVMRRLALEAGIPDQALVLDKEARSTRESLLQAREIMRYAGPRMLFRHPILAIAHQLDGLRKTRHPCEFTREQRLNSRKQ